MGFKVSWDIKDIESQLRRCAAESYSAYNDGWTSLYAKRDLVKLKWLLEDLLDMCPVFSEEEEKWAQERLIELLKRK